MKKNIELTANLLNRTFARPEELGGYNSIRDMLTWKKATSTLTAMTSVNGLRNLSKKSRTLLTRANM